MTAEPIASDWEVRNFDSAGGHQLSKTRQGSVGGARTWQGWLGLGRGDTDLVGLVGARQEDTD